MARQDDVTDVEAKDFAWAAAREVLQKEKNARCLLKILKVIMVNLVVKVHLRKLCMVLEFFIKNEQNFLWVFTMN